MATYIDNIVKFHTFSKSPVSKDTTLGGAVNPSGHTVTTSQVRAQDIPAFLNTFQGTKEQAITWLGNNYPTPAHNDIVFYGGEFKAGFGTPKCLKWNAKLETPAWEDFNITEAATLKNADDEDVIAVHQNCTTVFVDGSNNAATNSNRNSLFVKRADGSILDHFVASTDKIVAGMPSLGYNALVLWDGGAIDEGELDANYIGNTFAGIVHLNKQYSTGDDAKFKVTCFEYIGEKLDSTVSKLANAVFGEGGEDDPDASLTQKVAQNSAAIVKIEKEIDDLVTGVSSVTISDETYTDAKPGYAIVNQTPTSPEGVVEVKIDTSAIKSDIANLTGKVNALESGKLTYQVVHSLDVTSKTYKETSSADAQDCKVNVIYLVPDTTIGAYVEYLCCMKDGAKHLERIGTTATELDNYATWYTKDGKAATYDTTSSTDVPVKVTVKSGVTTAVTGVTVDIGTPAGTNTTATGLYAVIEKAKNDAITDAKVTISEATNSAIIVTTSETDANSFTIGVATAGTGTAGVTTISGSDAIAAGATGNAAATVAAVGATRSAIETLVGTIPSGATATTVVGYAKEVADVAKDAAQADVDALETFVGKLPDEGVTATTVVGYAEEVAGAAQTAAIADAKTAIVGSISAYEANGLKVTAPTNTNGTIGAATFAMTKATTAGQTGTVQLAGETGVADTTTGVVATAAQVKDYVEKNAKVSVSADDSASESVTSIKVAGNSGTDVVITTAKDAAANPADGAATITVSATLNKASVSDGTIAEGDGDKVVTAAGAQAIATAAVNALDAVSVGDGAVKVTQENGKVKTVSTETAAITSTTGETTTLVNAVASDTALVTAKEALKAIGVAKKYTDDEIATISGSLNTHTGNTDIHVSSDDRTAWETAATQAGTAIQGVGSISGTYITATAKEIDGHEITWQVSETGLANALATKANSADIVTYTGTAPISVTGTGTSRTISIATASSTATGAVQLAGETGVADTTTGVVATAAQVKSYVDDVKSYVDGIYGQDTWKVNDTVTTTQPTITVAIDLDATDKVTVSATDIASAAALGTLETKVNTHIADAAKLSIIVAEANTDGTPNVTTPSTNKIYLVQDTNAESGSYIEWIYVITATDADGNPTTYAWEKIGSTKTDLSGYAKTADIKGSVSGAGISATLENGSLTGSVITATVTPKSDGSVEIANESNVVTASGAQAIASAAVNALDKASHGNHGVMLEQTDGIVTLAVTEGAVNDTSENFVTGKVVNTAITDVINALDVAGDSVNGITWSQVDGKVSISVDADDEVTEDSTNVVTSGAVHTAIATAQAAATTKVANSDTEATALGYCRVSSTPESDGSTTYTVDNDPRITVTKEQLGTPSAVEGDVITGGSVKFVDWSKVEVAEGAFQDNTSLKSFHADLENLTNGNGMFSGCTGLTSFCGNLGSLTDGTNMFAGCNLDLESVIYIVDSLPAIPANTGSITIGVNSALVDENEIDALTTELSNKGWGGSVTTSGSVTTE